jgi:predicted RND superfamily exporter protein
MTYARELEEYAHPSLALFATLRKAGRAIIASSIALALGFSVVAGSSFVPMRQFGVFAALTMLLALVTELFVTPALMSSIRAVTVWISCG